ncbi:MAG: hypothetical protein KDE45_01605, partial [Caldilineaceae bacterium]|nr:hypothetical protein [Caldilineaceae bacterium]
MVRQTALYRSVFALLLVVALTVCLASPTLAQADGETQGIRPDAPAYAHRGPYPVGVRTFEIPASDETERDLVVTAWYPALNPDDQADEFTYAMSFAPGKVPNVLVYGNALENAAPDAADGPFPLVIHSHAWSSFQHELPYLSEQLASQGFVVLAPGHEDNWSKLSIPAPLGSEFRRPDEVRRTIDFAEELTAAGGELAGMVDVEHVGIAGWSHGGETALVASGARLDLANFVAWCEANTVDDTPPSDNCAEAQANQEELAQLIGLDAVPEGLWPDLGDARIDAAVALAPSTDLLGPEGLGSIDVPTLFILGSGDTSVGPFYFENAAFAQVNAARKAEVLLNDAEHLVFFSECSEIPEVVDLGFYFFCSDPVWDMDRAHDLTNHFTTAFFLAELK